MQTKTTVERAFELARNSECRTVADIRRMLTAEDYPHITAHLTGPLLRKQLMAIMRSMKTGQVAPRSRFQTTRA